MVLVIKLSTFAWNVHDGRQSPEVCLIISRLPVYLIHSQSLDPSQLATRILDYPSILEFLGYM
jgi:lysophospholipid acyltransferase